MFIFLALPPMPDMPSVPALVIPTIPMVEVSEGSTVVNEIGGGSVSITNSVSSSVNTGGNRAEGGEVIEGKAHSSVDITTVVNGEVLEDYHQDLEDGAIEIVKETISTSTGVKVETKVSVKANSTSSVSDQDKNKKITEVVEGEWSTSTPKKDSGVGVKIKTIFQELTNYVFSFFRFF